MFCKHCGKEIDDNAVICPYCGVETDKLNERVMSDKTTNAENGEKHNIFAIVGFILAAVSIALVFVNTISYFIVFAAGLALSVVGLVSCKKYKPYGKGLSIAGICICGAGLVFWIIMIAVVASLYASMLV